MTRPKRLVVKGIGASRGLAGGVAKVVRTRADSAKMAQGDIMIAVATNPHLAAAMLKASAIVTEEGGILSHAAIVARELGIPCVVGAERATAILNDGQRVLVDGNAGHVYEAD